jgi:iron complex transport system substrate-binding protein
MTRFKLVLFTVLTGLLISPTVSLQAKTHPVSGSRTITDLGGNVVTLPPAEQIKRVVIISPPTTSVLLSVIPDPKMIVGVNARAFTTSNPEIMARIFPNWKSVETKFVSAGFVSNTEELLNLKPDIVFYYGQSQKSGIDKINLPTVDFFKPGDNNPETVTIAWDKLMRQIFQVKSSTSLQDEWEAANQKTRQLLRARHGKSKSALLIFSNTGGKITVYGKNTYADTWFKKSGLKNVAATVSGSFEVSMEQIYQWDPDLIYVFIGSPAALFQANKIHGQDWSLLTAYRNKTIFDIPQAAYSWGAPCSDSPLMPLWLIHQSYPELLGKEAFIKYFKDYYGRMYRLQLEDALVNMVLNPRKPKK